VLPVFSQLFSASSVFLRFCVWVAVTVLQRSQCIFFTGRASKNIIFDLQLRQHDSILARQGLPPLLDPSARSQFRAICYWQISARLGFAVAKASVMHLLGVPRLPLLLHVPRAVLARNFPGPADSFSPPLSLTY
jgi:hypothetical protein